MKKIRQRSILHVAKALPLHKTLVKVSWFTPQKEVDSSSDFLYSLHKV